MKVTARVVNNSVAHTGSFTTSDPLLNKIQGAVARTQLNNLQQGMPLDCPTREKHGWLGDAGISAEEAMANFDMQSFYDKWFGDIRTSLNSDGSVTSVAPVQNRANEFITDPAWGSAYPQIVWGHYQQYGDERVLQTNYDQIKAWVDYLGTISNENHIVTDSPGSWGDDWQASVATPHVYYQTGFYQLDSQLLAQMATALGKTDDANTYADLASAIAEGFNATYFDADTNVYGTGTQFSYAMPLVLDIVPDGHRAAVADKLVADVVAHDDHVTTGFPGTTFVYQALAATGHNDVTLRIAQRTDGPSFGFMVTQGPGTIWEKWPNSSAADGTSSKDHVGLGGSIGRWNYQQLGGIQPGTAGWRTFTLAPAVVGDLTHVAATQQTVRGTVASEWTRSGGDLTYEATVPVGAEATVRLPATSPLAITEGGKALADADGVTLVSSAGSEVVLTVGSGTYTFTVRAAGETLASVLSDTADLQDQVAGLLDTGELDSATARTLTDQLDRVSAAAQAALALLVRSDPRAAAKVVEALNAATELQGLIGADGVSDAARAALTPRVTALVAALSTLTTTLAGVTVTVATDSADELLPGQAVDLAVTVTNSGVRPLRSVAVSAQLPDSWQADNPPDQAIGMLPPRQERTVHVSATVPADRLPGDVEVPVAVRFDYAGTSITAVNTTHLTVASPASITSATIDPATVAPGSTAVATVTIANTGSAVLTGQVAIDVPDGWTAPPASPDVQVPPGGSETVTVDVDVPTTLASQHYPLTAGFQRAGVGLASHPMSATGRVDVPTEFVDHIDLGDAASETAHALTASPTSGTNVEAGLTRRYAGSAPDSFFGFDLQVPIGGPFVIVGVETFDGPRLKEYTVTVDDVVVGQVHFQRSSDGPGSGTYQILVDDPAAFSSTGTVRVVAHHDPTAAWDPSLADVWTVPVA